MVPLVWRGRIKSRNPVASQTLTERHISLVWGASDVAMRLVLWRKIVTNKALRISKIIIGSTDASSVQSSPLLYNPHGLQRNIKLFCNVPAFHIGTIVKKSYYDKRSIVNSNNTFNEGLAAEFSPALCRIQRAGLRGTRIPESITRPTLRGACRDAPSENLRQHHQTHKSRKRNLKNKAANQEVYEAQFTFHCVVMNLEIRLEEICNCLKRY